MLIALLMCFFFCRFHLLFQLIYLLIHLEQIPVLMQDSFCSDDRLPLWKRDFVWKERTHAEECDSVLRVSVGELKETEVFILMRPPFASPASFPPFHCPRWKKWLPPVFPQGNGLSTEFAFSLVEVGNFLQTHLDIIIINVNKASRTSLPLVHQTQGLRRSQISRS